MRLVVDLVFKKALLLAALLLGGPHPPDSSEAVKCYQCSGDTRHPRGDMQHCFQNQVPDSDPAKFDGFVEYDCIANVNYDDQCLRRLTVFSSGDATNPANQNHLHIEKSCLQNGTIGCIEKNGVMKDVDNCYVMTLQEFNDYIHNDSCPLVWENNMSRLLEHDEPGRSPLRQIDAKQAMIAFCLCTGEYCNKEVPDAIFMKVGATRPAPSAGIGGTGGGGHGSGTSTAQSPKSAIMVSITVITLTFGVVGIRE